MPTDLAISGLVCDEGVLTCDKYCLLTPSEREEGCASGTLGFYHWDSQTVCEPHGSSTEQNSHYASAKKKSKIIQHKVFLLWCFL